MFRDVGKMLKMTGKLLFYVGIGVSVLYGLFMMIFAYFSVDVVKGIFIMLFGPLVSWVLSLVIYGMGEMIENSDIRTELMLKESKKKERTETEY